MVNHNQTITEVRRIPVSRYAFYTTLFFIILPLYSLPWIIKGMLKQKKWAFVLWACFMGLVGILVPPTGDFYRYTMDFYMYKDCDWHSFLVLALLKNDFMLPLLSYILGLLDWNFDLSRFIYNFWGYYLLGALYIDIVKRNLALQVKKNYIYVFVFFITLSLSAYCFRYGLSTIMFVYGAYCIVYKGKKRGWWYVFLSVFNHLSFIVFLFVLILQRMHFWGFSRKNVIVMIAAATFIDSTFIVSVFRMLPVDWVSHYMVYLDGYWAREYLEDHSWRYKMMQMFSSLIQYACVIIYVLCYHKGRKESLALVNATLFLSFITLPFVTVQTRFMSVMINFIKIHFLVHFDGGVRMTRYLKYMFWLVIISNLMGLWSFRREFSISDFSMMSTSSSFEILTHTYDKQWIERNVDEDGDLIQIKF